MIWDFTLSLQGESLLPVGTLTNADLAIDLSMPNKPRNWRKGGYLHPLIRVGDTDIPAQGIFIGFGSQVIQIPYQTYKLRFIPVIYLTNPYTLKLFKLPIMGISYPSTGNQSANTVNCSNFTPSTTASDVLAANPNRLPGSLLVNNTNVIVYIRFGGGLAAISGVGSSISLPAFGGAIDVPASYKGAVNCITATAPTGTMQVIEPII